MTHASSHRPAHSGSLRRDELILALEARERLLDSILGSLETFVAVDGEWRITFANRAAAERAHMPAEELIGRVLWETTPDASQDTDAPELRRAMNERVSVEYEAPGPEGRTYRGTAYPLDDGGLAIYSRDVTDARRAEAERAELSAALEQSERSFEAVFEASPFAMSLTEMPSATILRVNGAFERLFGYRREEIVGRTSPDLRISDPESQAEVARRFAEEGSVRELEVVRATRDGRLKTLSISLDWVMVGRREAVLTSIRDVTRQAEAQARLQASEDALRASEQRYRSIVETTGDGILIGDPSGVIVFVNQRMADMLGYGPDELVGMHGFDLIDTDLQAAVLDNRTALGEGEMLRGEFKLRRKDGSALWTMFSSTPMFDDRGRHTGNLTMHSDITELKAAEEARRESERTLRSFYDGAPLLMGVARLDAGRTTVVSANRALGEFLGMDPETLAGRSGVELGSTPELERALADAYLESQRTGRPARFEQAWDTRGRGRLVMALTVADIGAGPGGEPLFSFVAEDVTERRRAAEVLRAGELAAAAQEERSRLARDLHDSVTQALFAASLKAEALTTADGVSPETVKAVEDVRRLTAGALAQMRTMLLELRGEPLDSIPLRQLLRNVVGATQGRTKTRVKLTVEGVEEVPAGLHVAVYRIAQEALNNVARHAAADHAWIELHGEPSRVRLSVRDDGAGFEPGPRGPSHLGLRSMRERAAETGGELRIVSEPGQGTEVVVEWNPAVS